MTRIKICGITNLRDALLATEIGVDALGFIFTKSPRQISPEKAKEIIVNIPPFINKVGVFKNEKISFVKEVIKFCNLDYVQLHGDEDKSYIKVFLPRVIKVFEINGNETIKKIKHFSLPFFMLDLPKDKENASHNWKIIKKAKEFGRIILAGGLTPDNVERVLEKVSPYGVDVCSGVEKKEGIKSSEKLINFIKRVRKWDFQKN